jgi:hypothetical protein
MSIIRGNAKSASAIDRRVGRSGRPFYFDEKPKPSKSDLRAMLAQAVANTQASADSSTAVRIAKQGRQA